MTRFRSEASKEQKRKHFRWKYAHDPKVRQYFKDRWKQTKEKEKENPELRKIRLAKYYARSNKNNYNENRVKKRKANIERTRLLYRDWKRRNKANGGKGVAEKYPHPIPEALYQEIVLRDQQFRIDHIKKIKKYSDEEKERRIKEILFPNQKDLSAN